MTGTIGIIGTGMIGGQVARLAIAAGLDVILSNSRGPETLADLVAELGERARAATPAEAAREADLVVASIPFVAYTKLPAEALSGKIVSGLPYASLTGPFDLACPVWEGSVI